MKKIILIVIVFSLALISCEKEKTSGNGTKEVLLKSAEGDTLTIHFNEKIYLQDGKSWIKFDDVEESRCATNVECFWEGNAKVKLIYFDGLSEGIFYINTHGSEQMPSEVVLDNLYFNLVSVEPYPDGNEIIKENYFVQLYIQYLDKLDGINSEINGVVMDYTGLDGCGWIIILENGDKLEPIEVLPNVQFYDGQEVIIWYKEIDGVSSACMVGETVKIYKVESETCPSYTTISLYGSLDDYANDALEMDTAYIEDNTLYISIRHSGGCTDHVYKLLMYPITCATPPLPKPIFWLSHDAKGDLCETYLENIVCFDLSTLKNYYDIETEIEIRTMDNDKTIQLNF